MGHPPPVLAHQLASAYDFSWPQRRKKTRRVVRRVTDRSLGTKTRSRFGRVGPNQHHRLSRWYEEGPLKGPLVEFQVTPVLVPPTICWLRDAPPDLALINPGGAHAWSTTTAAPTEQCPFVCQRSRRIRCTKGTAEPIGVSPPEAVDLFLIKRRRVSFR